MNDIIWVALSGSSLYGILSYTNMKQFRELSIFMWEMVSVYRYSYCIQCSLHYKIIQIFIEYSKYIRHSENMKMNQKKKKIWRWIIIHCILRELKLYKRDKIYVYYCRIYKTISMRIWIKERLLLAGQGNENERSYFCWTFY